MSTHVQKPGWFTVNVFNRCVAFMTRRGLSIWGSRVLAVRGRKSGAWRTTPVNLLTVDGQQYLVAPAATSSGRTTCGPRAAANCASARGWTRSPRPRSATTTRFRCCAPTSSAGRPRSVSSSEASAPTPPRGAAAHRPRPPGLPDHGHELTGREPTDTPVGHRHSRATETDTHTDAATDTDTAPRPTVTPWSECSQQPSARRRPSAGRARTGRALPSGGNAPTRPAWSNRG